MRILAGQPRMRAILIALPKVYLIPQIGWLQRLDPSSLATRKLYLARSRLPLPLNATIATEGEQSCSDRCHLEC